MNRTAAAIITSTALLPCAEQEKREAACGCIILTTYYNPVNAGWTARTDTLAFCAQHQPYARYYRAQELTDRHKRQPISLRLTEADEAWLRDQASATSRPVRAIIADAIREKREREESAR